MQTTLRALALIDAIERFGAVERIIESDGEGCSSFFLGLRPAPQFPCRSSATEHTYPLMNRIPFADIQSVNLNNHNANRLHSLRPNFPSRLRTFPVSILPIPSFLHPELTPVLSHRTTPPPLPSSPHALPPPPSHLKTLLPRPRENKNQLPRRRSHGKTMIRICSARRIWWSCIMGLR